MMMAMRPYETAVGTAQTDYERIAGHGDRSSATPVDDDTEYPVNYRGSAYIGTYDRDVDNPANAGTPIAAPMTTIPDVLEAFGVDDPHGLVECGTNECTHDDDNTMWVKFTEDSANDSKFTNVNSDDVPSLKTTSNAQRGLSFTIEYDDTVTSGVGYSTTNIVIDAGDEWGSGEEISITLTDSDANTNSLTEDDLSVANPDHIIPTIEIGSPFTLAGTSADQITVTAPVGGTESPTNIDDAKTDAITTSDESVSKRLILGGDVATVEHNLLMIDLGTATDVGIHTGNSSGVTHVANFDVRALGEDTVAKINFGDDIDPTELGTGNGQFTLDTSSVSADTQVTLIIHILGAGEIEEAPIVFDIFSFGLSDTTDNTSNVNDAIYRLELEEDGDNSSDFTGTLEYIGLNQINILDEETYGMIDAISDAIILISDDDSVSVEYLDLDSTGGETLFTAEADTPTHSGVVSLDSDGYKVADTVTVTVTDADLNVDSGKADIYTTVAPMLILTSPILSAARLLLQYCLSYQSTTRNGLQDVALVKDLTPLTSRSGRPEATAACLPAPLRFRQTTVLAETTAETQSQSPAPTSQSNILTSGTTPVQS